MIKSVFNNLICINVGVCRCLLMTCLGLMAALFSAKTNIATRAYPSTAGDEESKDKDLSQSQLVLTYFIIVVLVTDLSAINIPLFGECRQYLILQ